MEVFYFIRVLYCLLLVSVLNAQLLPSVAPEMKDLDSSLIDSSHLTPGSK